MLYLAEVQKQKTGFIGAAKAELKLLTSQQTDQSWNPVPGEEVIPAEEANNFHPGTLVLAELNANRQVQRIQEAGRPLVSILQNFSRHVEKSKRKEEEIEHWKQSLTYQSQELSRRQMEMEVRSEQLEQIQDDFKLLEAQRQEITTEREQAERLRKEIARNRRELEAAWQHLQDNQRHLEEQQTEFKQGMVLDEATACQIQEVIERLSSGGNSREVVQQQLNFSFEMIATQQGILDQHWQQLEQQQITAQQQQEEVESQSLTLQNSNHEWQQAQNSLEQVLVELKVQMSTLNSKQEYAQMLGDNLRNQEALYQQIYRLTETSDKVNVSQKIDLEQLEKMPLDELQQLVNTYNKTINKVSDFVNDQEEELKFQQEKIDELLAALQHAPEHERMKLETELAEEQDRHQLLNETLLGQRLNLQERQEILSQHQAVLRQRQGLDSGNGQQDNKIDLGPILLQIQVQRQQQSEELKNLEQQIYETRDRLNQTQETIDNQAHEHEMKRQELQSLEQNLFSLRAVAAECWGRVNFYQEALQPIQDSLDGLRQTLEAIATALEQVPETDAQIQTLLSLISSPELATP